MTNVRANGTMTRYSNFAASWDDIAIGMGMPVAGPHGLADGVVTDVRADEFVVAYLDHADYVEMTCPRGGARAREMLARITRRCDYWTGVLGLPVCDYEGLRAVREVVAAIDARRAVIERSGALHQIRAETDRW